MNISAFNHENILLRTKKAEQICSAFCEFIPVNYLPNNTALAASDAGSTVWP